MKRNVLILCILISIWGIEWGVKARMPINRPENLQEEYEKAWYESSYTSPIADSEWQIDPSIPENYIPVPGKENTYMVLDDNGEIKGYVKRIPKGEDEWEWQEVNPDIPENYQAVKGRKDIYQYKDKENKIHYVKYIRNKGEKKDSYAFVEVDKNGTALDDGENADVIGSNYILESDNTYALYNENNVKVGYRKRVKKDGHYVWKETAAPKKSKEKKESTIPEGKDKIVKGVGVKDGESKEKEVNNDGSYVETKTHTETKVENGITITYKTKYTNTYSSDGKLIKTVKDGPYEISRKEKKVEKPNKEKVASNIKEEYKRIAGKVTFNKNKANEILSKLNAQRVSNGIPTLQMSESSEAMMLARIKACDMAIYSYASSKSDTYGTLKDMCQKWKIETSNPSENIWKAGSIKNASEIHSRFQSNENARKIRMSNGYQEVGIAVVEKEEQIYIAEVFLR